MAPPTRASKPGFVRLCVLAASALVLPAAMGACAASDSSVPPTQPAVRVSLQGDDGSCGRGAEASPCASFHRAFEVAQGGDEVEIEAGSYGPQAIGPSAVDKGATVTFRPAPGASVSVSSLSISASHVAVVDVVASGTGESRGGLDVCDTECVPGLQDVLIRNFRGKFAFIRASNVTVDGGEFGDFDACRAGDPEDAFRLWGGDAVHQPENDVVEGVTIHDVGSGAGNTCEGTTHAGYHVDCLQTQGGVNIRIQDDIFYHCATSDIQAEPFDGAVERNWLVQNNVFAPTACCNSVVLTQAEDGGDCSTLVIRYNDLASPPNDAYCQGGHLQLYGNIFTEPVQSCLQNTNEAYDVYPARNPATCAGRGNRKCNPAFASPNAAPPDYRLLPVDRCARGAGDPKLFPHSDAFRHPRPEGVVPEAGAYEFPVKASKD
jgi:hypothetical protein